MFPFSIQDYSALENILLFVFRRSLQVVNVKSTRFHQFCQVKQVSFGGFGFSDKLMFLGLFAVTDWGTFKTVMTSSQAPAMTLFWDQKKRCSR